MAVAQIKQKLPILLKKISLKLNSLFFQRLVLLEQQPIDSQNVRHYDLQCEGIQILVSFFKTKQQNLLFKGFMSIKQGLKLTSEKVVQVNPKPNGTTRRTFLNTTFTASEYSPIKEFSCPTIKSLRSEKSSSFHNKSSLNKTSTNLQLLLNRVKLANSRQQGVYSFRQQQKTLSNQYEQRENYSNYTAKSGNTAKVSYQEQRFRTNPSNLDQQELSNYTSQMMSTRNSRRQFIMDKFSQIENQLHELNGKKEVKRPQLSKQILNQINNIKHRLKFHA